MTRTLAHRGPDAEGYFRSGGTALGHRRLSVIDLAASMQPMTTADGRYTLVYNGEIYNFAQLRSELAADGERFSTVGDTEVLLLALVRYGLHVLPRLRGMFAFALWDDSARSLTLARDPFGVKPLYYYWDGELFAFASELKALRAHPDVRVELDADALGLYLECQFIPSPRTAYRQVHKLEAASTMVLQDGQLAAQRYWRVSHGPKIEQGEDLHVRQTDEALRESVRGMLIADVPLGCFLSGGVDSSLLAAMATDLLQRPIDTFHLGYNGRNVGSEHVEAARVAEHLGSRHHVLMLEPDDLRAGLDAWIEVFDEPFGDAAALPTMMLSHLARKHVTVALSGEGADEIFGGYDNYSKRARDERFVRVLAGRASPLPALLRTMPESVRRDRFLRALLEPVERRYATIPNVFDRIAARSTFSPAFMAMQSSSVLDRAAALFLECDSPEYVERIMHVDARLWLVDDLLVKIDRATMAASLEARVPYLDHRFVEFVSRLPASLKRPPGNGRGKHILKKVAERYLPTEIAHRRKQGFMLPLAQWFGGPLRPALLESIASLGRRGLFRPGVLARIVEEQDRGRNRVVRLWNVFVLERWLERYAPDFRVI